MTLTVGDGLDSLPTLISGLEFGITDGTNGGANLIDFGENETASHGILPQFFLGDMVLPDPDSGADNDGVSFVTGIHRGATETLSVEATQSPNARGYFNGWIDFNGDGTFSDAEQIVRNRRLDSGDNTLTFEVPSSAPFVTNVLARFRWGFERDLGPTGYAIAGEVEDYRVDVPQDGDTGTVAINDEFTVSENSTDNLLDVLFNDLKLDDTVTLDIDSVTQPANGMVTITQGTGGQNDTLLYTPDPDYFGPDTFTYTVTDNLGGSDTAMVTMMVDEVVAGNRAPIAMDDNFIVDEATSNNFLDILDNDSDPDGDPLQIFGVTMPTGGGNVTITETGLLYTPAPGFTGPDSFMYTIQDPSGLMDTATVMINVSDISSLVRYRLEATDPGGIVISEVVVGQDFQLNVYVEDLRADAQGVFSGYLDVTYDSTLAAVAGGLTYGPDYPNVPSGSTTTPGLIDEAGATDGFEALGAGERLLWSLPFTGNSPGTLFFTGDPADVLPAHETTVYGLDDAIDNMLLEFVNTSIVVNAAAAGVVDDMFSVVQDSVDIPLPVLSNDVPPAGADPFTLISVTDPAHGMAMTSGDQVLYTPDPGYTGPDSFMYTVRDANNVESTATVTIDVTAPRGLWHMNWKLRMVWGLRSMRSMSATPSN